MFVVMRLCKFEFKTNVRLPLVFKGEEVGYLPVFATRDEALKGYPDSAVLEAQFVEKEEEGGNHG